MACSKTSHMFLPTLWDHPKQSFFEGPWGSLNTLARTTTAWSLWRHLTSSATLETPERDPSLQPHPLRWPVHPQTGSHEWLVWAWHSPHSPERPAAPLFRRFLKLLCQITIHVNSAISEAMSLRHAARYYRGIMGNCLAALCSHSIMFNVRTQTGLHRDLALGQQLALLQKAGENWWVPKTCLFNFYLHDQRDM